MSGTLWKIARQSKQGRKKENRALFFVLFFLFFLTAAGITWFSAAGKVQEEERYSAFGEWKAAYYGADEAQRDQFSGKSRHFQKRCFRGGRFRDRAGRGGTA